MTDSEPAPEFQYPDGYFEHPYDSQTPPAAYVQQPAPYYAPSSHLPPPIYVPPSQYPPQQTPQYVQQPPYPLQPTHYFATPQVYWPIRPVGPRPRVKGLAWVAVAAGGLGLIGAVGVWGTVHGADAVLLGRGTSIHGTESGGRLTLILSIAVLVLALVLMARTLLGVAISVLVCGTLIALIGIANVVDIKAIAPPALDRYGLSLTIGAGLWLTVVAGLASAFAGLMAIIRGQRT
jgi:hypothetical protein